MNITQTFYDQLAEHYDKLFADWTAAVREQAELPDRLSNLGLAGGTACC